MKKLKMFWLMGKEWVIEKWNGEVYDRIIVAGIACVLIFLILILIS